MICFSGRRSTLEALGDRTLRSHILITNEDTFPIVRDYGFWGSGKRGIPSSMEALIASNLRNPHQPYFSMVCDMLGTRDGDTVFIYERQAGFHGVYEIAGAPFFDTTTVGCIDGTWPIRILLRCVHFFPKPVPEDLLFSTRANEERLWTWFYRKIQGGRALNTINPEAALAIIEMLVKLNGNASEQHCSTGVYTPSGFQPLHLPLGKGSSFPLEDILRAWLISNIDDPARMDMPAIFGPVNDMEWFANNVPYHVSRKNIDVLVYHKNYRYTNHELRYKYSVVELKKDRADEKDVDQVIRYSKWVAGRLADGENNIVQPVLIAYDFTPSAINKARTTDFNDGCVLEIAYRIEDGNVTTGLV